MPCNDELENENALSDALEEAELGLKHAEGRLKTKIKASIAACGIGAGMSILGGPTGALAGGGLCLAAIFEADDAATDYDLALAQAELAHERHMRALLASFSCLSRCGPVNS